MGRDCKRRANIMSSTPRGHARWHANSAWNRRRRRRASRSFAAWEDDWNRAATLRQRAAMQFSLTITRIIRLRLPPALPRCGAHIRNGDWCWRFSRIGIRGRGICLTNWRRRCPPEMRRFCWMYIRRANLRLSGRTAIRWRRQCKNAGRIPSSARAA